MGDSDDYESEMDSSSTNCFYFTLGKINEDIQNLKRRNSQEEDERQHLEKILREMEKENEELTTENLELTMKLTIGEKELHISTVEKANTQKEIEDLTKRGTKLETRVTNLENQTKHLKLLAEAKIKQWTESIKRYEERMLQSPAGKQKREATIAYNEAMAVLDKKTLEYETLKKSHDELSSRIKNNWELFVRSCVQAAQDKAEAIAVAKKINEQSVALEKAKLDALSKPITPTATGFPGRSAVPTKAPSSTTFLMQKLGTKLPIAPTKYNTPVAGTTKSTTPVLVGATKSTTPVLAGATKFTTIFSANASKSTTSVLAGATKFTTPVLAGATNCEIGSSRSKTWGDRFGTSTASRTSEPGTGPKPIVPRKLQLDMPPPPPPKDKPEGQTNNAQVVKPRTTTSNPDVLKTPSKDSTAKAQADQVHTRTPYPFQPSENKGRGDISRKTLDLEDTSSAMELDMMEQPTEKRPPTPSTSTSVSEFKSPESAFSGLLGLSSTKNSGAKFNLLAPGGSTQDSDKSASEDFFMSTFGVSPFNLF